MLYAMKNNPVYWPAMGAAFLLLLGTAPLQAQGHGPAGGGMGGFGGSRGGLSRGMTPEHFHNGDVSIGPPRSSGSVPVHSGFQVGPPGRWWDDRAFAKTLGIEQDQKKRMDSIFNSSKGELSNRLNDLRREETVLGSLTRAKDLDEQRIMGQIDRVAQARAELEKSTAKMLLQIRKELTPEQVKRLADQQDAQATAPLAAPPSGANE